MEAVARELVGGDIIAELAGICALGDEVADHAMELSLRLDKLVTPVHGCREFCVMVAVGLLREERIGLEHCFEAPANIAYPVSYFREIFEVGRDLPLVPCEQDRLDI